MDNVMAYSIFDFEPTKSYSKEEIKKRYKILSVSLHPDKNKNTPHLFKLLKDAFDFLMKDYISEGKKQQSAEQEKEQIKGRLINDILEEHYKQVLAGDYVVSYGYTPKNKLVDVYHKLKEGVKKDRELLMNQIKAVEDYAEFYKSVYEKEHCVFSHLKQKLIKLSGEKEFSDLFIQVFDEIDSIFQPFPDMREDDVFMKALKQIMPTPRRTSKRRGRAV